MFPQLAPPSLVPSEHFVLKVLSFYKVVRLVDFEARQTCLEKRERKRQDGTLRQVLAIGCLSSSSFIHPHTQKKKKPATHHVQRVRTPSPASSSSSSISSSSFSSSFSDEPKIGVN